MIIHITDTLTYDTDKAFEKQDNEVREYIEHIIGYNTPDRMDVDEYKRETCRYWNICDNAVLKYVFVYDRAESAWNAKELKIEMEVLNV